MSQKRAYVQQPQLLRKEQDASQTCLGHLLLLLAWMKCKPQRVERIKLIWLERSLNCVELVWWRAYRRLLHCHPLVWSWDAQMTLETLWKMILLGRQWDVGLISPEFGCVSQQMKEKMRSPHWGPIRVELRTNDSCWAAGRTTLVKSVDREEGQAELTRGCHDRREWYNTVGRGTLSSLSELFVWRKRF